MKLNLRKKSSVGFALIEIILIIAVIAVITGLAATYYNQQKQSNSTVNNNKGGALVNNSDESTQTLDKLITTPTGTTTSITELITKAAEFEESIDISADSQIQTSATSANSAITNIGGAYDVSNL